MGRLGKPAGAGFGFAFFRVPYGLSQTVRLHESSMKYLAKMSVSAHIAGHDKA
jgi:hypothetical protein